MYIERYFNTLKGGKCREEITKNNRNTLKGNKFTRVEL